MMRAGWYERKGPAEEVIKIGEMATPSVGPGEVLVRMHASGINPSDYKRRANVDIPMEFPRVIPHSDGAGIIAACGEGVTGLREGDRVWTFNAQWLRPFGTAAEFTSLPARLVWPLPRDTSFTEGACLGIPAMTGYHSVHVAGSVKGKTVYIPGASGRVGAYALQFAKWRGARTIASTGGGEKSRVTIASLGADIVLDRRAVDLEAQLMHATEGRGVDHIVEVDLPGSLGLDERVLAEGGGIVSFGAPTSPSVTITHQGRRARNMGLHYIQVYLLDGMTCEAICRGIVEAAESGALRHRIGGIFPLMDLARAHSSAERDAGAGHIIVEI
jgi:NADPH2:quinone reductase